MKKINLYHLTTKGKVKTWMVSTSDASLIVEWGLLGGKIQKSTKICKAMNEGKTNATTPREQAVVEALALIVEQKKSGYTESIPQEGGTIVNATLDLENLPAGFVLSKPISKCPAKVENGNNTYAQRKYNGNCLILKKTAKGEQVFSRGMEDLTATMLQIPEVRNVMNAMNIGDMLNTEMRFVKKDETESTATLGSLVRTQDPVEAMQKYKEYNKQGCFEIVAFDKIFHRGVFIGNYDYLERYEELKKLTVKGVSIPDLIYDWQGMVYDKAKSEGWEGFVLRVKGESFITYTLNGKADRAGAYKYKFVKEGDFYVSEVKYGESGKHATIYAKFKLEQWKKGILLDCGWAGPGKLTHEQLAQYTKEINDGKLHLPFVVEVEFRDRQEVGYKLEHPVIQRLRFDKKPKECEYEN